MTTQRRRAFSVIAALALAAPAARATPDFPAAIAQHLATPHVPPCSDCHDGTPQKGTATSAFAVAMRSRGLLPNDESSLATALDALAGEQTDSDGDGIPDIDELKRGWDPNLANTADGGVVPGATRTHVLVPTYGCAVTTPGRGACDYGASMLVSAWVVVVVTGRRRSRERRLRRFP